MTKKAPKNPSLKKSKTPATSTPKGLVKVGTKEFDEKCEAALRQVAEKYAWTAQQDGVVLRRNPLKIPPMRDRVYNRMAKAEYGFNFERENGSRGFWYPRFEDAFGMTLEGELELGITVAERIEYVPGQGEIGHDDDGCRVLNLWRPPKWRQAKRSPPPKPFLDHLEYIIGSDGGEYEHVLNFLAHLVQRPQERIAHALLITSEAKGVGKSTLGLIIRRLVGEQNSRVAQTKDLKSNFDGWLVGNLVVQVDEVYEQGNWDLANKLKPLITEKVVSVNIKYGPQLEIQNYARLILFSNHAAPLNVEDGDRRYFIINSPAKPKDDDYYEALNRYIDSDKGMTDIYSYLMRRDLSAFNPHKRPPMTAAKKAVIKASVNPLRTYVAESVQSGHFEQNLGSTFSFDQIQRLLQRDGYGNHAKNMRELGEALKEAGVGHVRKKEKGSKIRLFALPKAALKGLESPF